MQEMKAKRASDQTLVDRLEALSKTMMGWPDAPRTLSREEMIEIKASVFSAAHALSKQRPT